MARSEQGPRLPRAFLRDGRAWAAIHATDAYNAMPCAGRWGTCCAGGRAAARGTGGRRGGREDGAGFRPGGTGLALRGWTSTVPCPRFSAGPDLEHPSGERTSSPLLPPGGRERRVATPAARPSGAAAPSAAGSLAAERNRWPSRGWPGSARPGPARESLTGTQAGARRPTGRLGNSAFRVRRPAVAITLSLSVTEVL